MLRACCVHVACMSWVHTGCPKRVVVCGVGGVRGMRWRVHVCKGVRAGVVGREAVPVTVGACRGCLAGLLRRKSASSQETATRSQSSRSGAGKESLGDSVQHSGPRTVPASVQRGKWTRARASY